MWVVFLFKVTASRLVDVFKNLNFLIYKRKKNVKILQKNKIFGFIRANKYTFLFIIMHPFTNEAIWLVYIVIFVA